MLASVGVKINGVFLMHVNPDYVRQGRVDQKEFFRILDVTAQVSDLAQVVEEKIDGMLTKIRQTESPQVAIGFSPPRLRGDKGRIVTQPNSEFFGRNPRLDAFAVRKFAKSLGQGSAMGLRPVLQLTE